MATTKATHHVIGSILRLLVHIQTLLARHLVAQHLVRLVDALERSLGALHVVAILVRMHQHRQAAVFLLDLLRLGGRIDLQHFERVQVKVCGAGTQQPIDLLVGRQHRVAAFDFFDLRKNVNVEFKRTRFVCLCLDAKQGEMREAIECRNVDRPLTST